MANTLHLNLNVVGLFHQVVALEAMVAATVKYVILQ